MPTNGRENETAQKINPLGHYTRPIDNLIIQDKRVMEIT